MQYDAPLPITVQINQIQTSRRRKYRNDTPINLHGWRVVLEYLIVHDQLATYGRLVGACWAIFHVGTQLETLDGAVWDGMTAVHYLGLANSRRDLGNRGFVDTLRSSECRITRSSGTGRGYVSPYYFRTRSCTRSKHELGRLLRPLARPHHHSPPLRLPYAVWHARSVRPLRQRSSCGVRCWRCQHLDPYSYRLHPIPLPSPRHLDSHTRSSPRASSCPAILCSTYLGWRSRPTVLDGLARPLTHVAVHTAPTQDRVLELVMHPSRQTDNGVQLPDVLVHHSSSLRIPTSRRFIPYFRSPSRLDEGCDWAGIQ